MKKNKFRAQKVDVDGIKFDSKWEAERYNQLQIMQRTGQIKDLQRQVKFILLDGYINNKGEKIGTFFKTFKYNQSYSKNNQSYSKNC